MAVRHRLFDSGRDGVWRDLGLLMARVSFSTILIWRHGASKVPALVAHPVEFLDPLGLGPAVSLALATFAECVCTSALALGILSRLACVPLVINFAVIVFVLHGAQVPGDRGELALLFLVAFTALLVTGPGRYSLDERFGRERTPS
jgi:putative oxidoreductase